MSRQSRWFDKAAEYERHKNLTSDPMTKRAFRRLRDICIVLANETGLSAHAIGQVERCRQPGCQNPVPTRRTPAHFEQNATYLPVKGPYSVIA
jgi:hypothetical protein